MTAKRNSLPVGLRGATLVRNGFSAWGLMFVVATASCGESLRFTITADPRPGKDGPNNPLPPNGAKTPNQPKFAHTLRQITENVGGPGAFHLIVGDLDPVASTDAAVRSEFGADVPWYPVVGNHDDMEEDLRFIDAHSANLPNVVRGGPTTSPRQPIGVQNTTYSFDYGDVHFVVLDQYFTGGFASSDGDVDDATLPWLADDLDATEKPFVLVFGHEPAYPRGGHVGDSLDLYPAHRDRFWRLLSEMGVQAYICAHTHYFSALEKDGVWQIDAGNAAHDYMDVSDGLTFLDVTVSTTPHETTMRLDVWRGGPVPRDNTDYFTDFLLHAEAGIPALEPRF